MSQIPVSTDLFGASAAQAPSQPTDAFAQLDTGAFINLLIAELQNQDPLNPQDNDALLNQIFQLRQIESDDALTETLEAVLLGQNVASATSLIGADVEGLTDGGERVVGNVGQVILTDGQPTLELEIDVNAVEGDQDGAVPSGQFIYEIVSTASDGVLESFVIGVDTAQLEEFSGSVQINNLPFTQGQRQIFRSDPTAQGERRLVATIPGASSTFVDIASDADLGNVIEGPRRSIPASRSVSVSLNNVGTITPPDP